MNLDPKVWGPHYWFVFYSIALCYPNNPNNIAKKKFYNFVQNLPIFIPHEKISVTFSNLIDKYPVSPYLDNKDTLVRWFHFIHNTINKNMGKPSISLADSLDKYYYNYKPQEELKKEWINYIKQHIFIVIVVILIASIIYLYNI